jgi:hypothetical protein
VYHGRNDSDRSSPPTEELLTADTFEATFRGRDYAFGSPVVPDV